MKYALLVVTLAVTTATVAQTTKPAELTITQAGPKTPDSNTVYQFVQIMPKPTVDIMQYLATNLTYPDSARKYKIQGRVAIQFVVNEDGSLSDFRTLRGIGYGCEEEAIKVMKSMPPWIPAKQDGKVVKVYYTQPISFRLQ